jgi:hypothetical protein
MATDVTIISERGLAKEEAGMVQGLMATLRYKAVLALRG